MNTTVNVNRPPAQPAVQPPVVPSVPPPVVRAPLPAHEYHQRLGVERPAAWRGIVALLLLMGGMLAFSLFIGGAAFLIEMGIRGEMPTGLTPLTLAGAMVALAMLTPWSMLLQKWFFKVPMVSLHSIINRFRWDIFGRTLAIVVPLWALLQLVYPVLMPQPSIEYGPGEALAYIVIALTLVPLQSMGEEYAFRGLAFRIAASWGRGPRAALVLGIAVSSVLFMLAHFALDPWLNIYYLTFGVALALITWRTGGLEAAVVLHAVNNALAFTIGVALRQDLDAGFDRSVGAASAVMLIPSAVLVLIALIVWWRTSRAARAE
ncbi:lysostaphin resistance A-like protein [Enemella sp. A6]|uniref:CPBP family intramembrane glutamic endopeptidase n=1 Tax=Enemella sp. A6 TaxID=3440152 RepID=UPI003EBBF6A1